MAKRPRKGAAAPKQKKKPSAKQVEPPLSPEPVAQISPEVVTGPGGEDESVIMLSSAENSLQVLDDTEPSLILREPHISVIDLARPSTRLSDMDITMEVTARTEPRFSAMPIDSTDLSLTNIIQTPGVHRERPKSSVVPRRTSTRRSFALPPVPLFEEDPPAFTVPAGEFSTVTTRRPIGGRARRPLESIVEDAINAPEVEATPQVSKVSSRKRAARIEQQENASESDVVPKPGAETPQVSKVSRRRNATKKVVASASKATRRKENEPVVQCVVLRTPQIVRRDAPQEDDSATNQAPIATPQISKVTSRRRQDRAQQKDVDVLPLPESLAETVAEKDAIALRQTESCMDFSIRIDQVDPEIEVPVVETPIGLKITKRRNVRKPVEVTSSAIETLQAVEQTGQVQPDEARDQDKIGTPQASKVSIRRKKNLPVETELAIDEVQNPVPSAQKDEEEVSTKRRRRPNPKYFPEPTPTPSKRQSLENPDNSSKKRPKLDSNRNHTEPEESAQSDTVEPEQPRGRARKRSNSRDPGHQTRPRRAIKSNARCPCCVGKVHESLHVSRRASHEQVETAVPEVSETRRGRSKSVARGPAGPTAEKSKTKSVGGRSKSVTRETSFSSQKSMVVSSEHLRPSDKSAEFVGRGFEPLDITTPEPRSRRGRSKSRGPSSMVQKPESEAMAVPQEAPLEQRKHRGRSKSRRPSTKVQKSESEPMTVPQGASLEPKSRRGRSKSRGPSSKVQESESEPLIVPQKIAEARNPRGRSKSRGPSSKSQEAIDVELAKNKSSTVPQEAPKQARRGRSKSAVRGPTGPSSKRSKMVARKSVDGALNSHGNVQKESDSQPTAARARSKSVSRKSSQKETETRSRSVSRGPGSTEHVPIYRKRADDAPRRSKSVLSLVPVSPAKSTTTSGDDVYAFDLSDFGKSEEGNGRGRKRTRNPAKAKRSASASSTTRKRATPAKKPHLQLFGTDMHRINSVVKKIGGGPVRRQQQQPDDKQGVQQKELAKPGPSGVRNIPPRSDSALSNYDGHHYVDEVPDFGTENDENLPEPPPPPQPVAPPAVPQVNKLLEKVQQNHLPRTPDKPGPSGNATLSFSPLGASSPWRVQDENELPKTFYFSRSKDLLPSYECDMVEIATNPPTAVPKEQEPSKTVSPTTSAPPPPPAAKAEAMFRSIQQSYEQLKVTSEMSEKLISAMRKYKTANVASANQSVDDLPEDEHLIAKFREYEQNMKRTYEKLRQWYERSQQTLTHSMRAIQQVSDAPKTASQAKVLENFRRESQQFVSMINSLESAMNDSNIENVAPPKPISAAQRPAFKDIILTERNLANRDRSPLKTLEIANVPPPGSFSLVNSPLVKASFSAQHKPPSEAQNETLNTTKKDLFGFEEDADSDSELDQQPVVEPTPMKITRDTLKERLQSVRKMLPPPRPPSRTAGTSNPVRRAYQGPKIFGSPSKTRSVASAFTSTPVMRKAPAAKTGPAAMEDTEQDISAIGEGVETANAPSPAVDLFEELKNGSLNNSAVNRTYSRVPRRNPKRKRNIYLADLGLSSDDEESEEEEVEEVATKKKRRAPPAKKKNPVEQTQEFQKFVSEFNSMCDEVNRYQMVVEKPAATSARQRV